MTEELSDFERELIGAVREARSHAEGRKRLKATTVCVPDVRLDRAEAKADAMTETQD